MWSFEGIVDDSGLVMMLSATELFAVDGAIMKAFALNGSGLIRQLHTGFSWTDGLVMGLFCGS